MSVLKVYNTVSSSWEELGGGVNIEGAPIGSVLPYAGTTAPSGWLLCSGQAVSRSLYDKLFDVIGTSFGTGDGSTTFNLPDLRGRAVAGKDNMGGISANRLTGQSGGLNGDILGASGGSERHTLTSTEVPNTEVKLGADGIKFTSGTYDVGGIGSGSLKLAINTANTNARVEGSNGSHNNVQPTVVLNYIIKCDTSVSGQSADDPYSLVYFNAYRSTTKNVTANTYTSIDANQERYDSHDCYKWDTASNAYVFVCPTTGIYEFTAGVNTEGISNARGFLRHVVSDGPNNLTPYERGPDNDTTNARRVQHTFSGKVAAGTKIKIEVWMDSAGNIQSGDTFFSGKLIGRV